MMDLSYYMNIARAVNNKQKCLKRNVGAVLVREDRVLLTGYNGTATGVTNCTEGGCPRCGHPDRYRAGEHYDRCICIHAEMNMFLTAAKNGISVGDSTVFSTLQPCLSCLNAIVQVGVKKVYFFEKTSIPHDCQNQYQNLALHLNQFTQLGGTKNVSQT